MIREEAHQAARDWLRVEDDAGLLSKSRPEFVRRQFEVVVALSSVPTLDPWLVVPVAGGSGARLLGLAGGQLCRVVAVEGDAASFATTLTRCEDVSLTITESVTPMGPMGPQMSYMDASVTRVWRFVGDGWGEVSVSADREWPDEEWRGVGRQCQRLVEEAGLAPRQLTAED